MSGVCGIGSGALGEIYSQQNEDIELRRDGVVDRARDIHTGQRFLDLPEDVRRQHAASAMLDVYGADGDTRSLRTMLHARPEYLAEIAQMTGAELDELIQAQMEREGTDSVFDSTPAIIHGIAEECMASFVHNNIRERGQVACAQSLESIEHARASIDAVVCQLNTVLPQSAHGVALVAAGLQPGSITTEQISTRLDALERNVRAVSGRLDGNSWIPSEFPRALDAALRELGSQSASQDSMVWKHIQWEARKEKVYHAVTTAAHVGVILASGGHALILEAGIFLLAEAAFAGASHAHRPTQEQLARTANMIGL